MTVPTLNDEIAAAVRLNHEASDAIMHGDTSVIQQVYCHSEDVTLLGNGGSYEVGWAAVADRFEWVAAQFVDGELEHRLISSARSGDLAYTFELTTGRVRYVDSPAYVPIAVRETHVWRRQPDGWKVLHRHADQLLEKVEKLSDIDQSRLEANPADAGPAHQVD